MQMILLQIKTMMIGFVVNPIAGMGGKVGLKGTDNILNVAIERGAEPVAPRRAVDFLLRLKEFNTDTKIEVLTCPGIMGENEAAEACLNSQILPMKIGQKTTASDTKEAVRLMIASKVDLIVFVGGDGTAKDVLEAMRCNAKQIPVLGVPSGVKMYSGIFAMSPSDAAEIVVAFAHDQAEMEEFEIMDADEEAIRLDVFAVKLQGILKGPFLPAHIQGSKQISPQTVDEKDNQTAIARFIIEEMQQDGTYILGPGTTVRRIAEILGVEKTVLGVDIYKKGKVILDVDEKRILEEIDDWNFTWIILSPIGRQGILLGRGNQQISPRIVKLVGKERIVVAATKSKLQSIEENVLRVDSGDAQVDEMLKGFIRVVTDYREWRITQVQ